MTYVKLKCCIPACTDNGVGHEEAVGVMGIGTNSLADRLDATLAHLSRASDCVVLRHYARGDVLYRQDEPASHMFYIVKGMVRTYILSPDGRERTFLIVRSGDLLGDAPFYLESKHLANAAAFGGEVGAYRIAREGFDCLLRADSELVRMLLANLAQRAYLLAQGVASQSFQDVRGRVQVALVQLAGQHGIVTREGIVIDMRITHEELARLVSANRATVSACLSRLQRDGFFRVIDQRIVLAPWAAGQLLPP